VDDTIRMVRRFSSIQLKKRLVRKSPFVTEALVPRRTEVDRQRSADANR
jgi:hypothetical protein